MTYLFAFLSALSFAGGTAWSIESDKKRGAKTNTDIFIPSILRTFGLMFFAAAIALQITKIQMNG